MENTVLSPGPGQSIVSSTRGWYGHGVDALDPLIVAEQAAYGRQNAEFAADIQRTIKDSEANLQLAAGGYSSGAQAAIGSTNTRIESSTAHTADRIYETRSALQSDLCEATKDVVGHVVAARDVTRDVGDRLRSEMTAIERNQLARLNDVENEVLKSKGKILRKLCEDHSAIMLESAKQYADLKATIQAEGTATRQQAADFRMRDLEAQVSKLNLQLVAAKP